MLDSQVAEIQRALAADPRLAEFVLGALVGIVLITALSRLQILRAAILLLLFVYLAQTLVVAGVDGLMADAAQLVTQVRAHLAFFQGLAIGKLVGGLAQARNLRRRAR